MGPKIGGISGKARKTLTIELKKEIVEAHRRGARVAELSKKFNLSKSTIGTILAQKEKLQQAQVSVGITKLYNERRRKLIDEMEKLLMIWISDQQMKADPISRDVICEKALMIYEDLKKKNLSSTEGEEFKASRGWFERFKKRTGIHNVMHGEAAISDKKAAQKFAAEFQKLIEEEDYSPHQLFNCNETGLFWKRMPNRTYISREERKLPGHKPMKDRLTLLFAANASGVFKVKPMLVYHSENPRPFKKKGVMKSRLPVLWKSNDKAWVISSIFKEWIFEVFAPSVKKFLEDMNLPLKALLLMGNVRGHPKDLEEELAEEYDWLKVMVMPPNTISILQPMDQQVLANFKILYTKALFRNCFDKCQFSPNEMSIKRFWTEDFDIVEAIRLIQRAWDQVTPKTLNCAWRALVPNFVQGPPADDADVVEEIVETARELQMEVDEDDIEELLEDYQQELTVEELQDIANEDYQQTQKDLSSEEENQEDRKTSLSTGAIKEHLLMWEKLRRFCLDTHPDYANVSELMDMFEEEAMCHYRTILQKREKQTTFDKFFKRKPPKTPSRSST